MAIRKGSSYKDRPVRKKTAKTRAFEHALDIELMILDRMEELGLKKKDLAEQMGMSRSGLSNALNGQPNMTLETMARFEMALNAVFEISLKPTEQYEFSIGVADERANGRERPDVELLSSESPNVTNYVVRLGQPVDLAGLTANTAGKSALITGKELCAA